ncbi:MAG: hypothetical protein KIT02_09955 [Devosia sp.]|uniref:hypothetical protein n=1 Tax=Devosia sp. TaxID=1871048 RepID=UPI0024C6FDA0|nr:hypothetical protein [Devosia sp.]UYN98295.1 MAG: hypothetical protein KIT02_09955 [Devosia sp.]
MFMRIASAVAIGLCLAGTSAAFEATANPSCTERVCVQWISGNYEDHSNTICERYEIRIKPQCYTKLRPGEMNIPKPRNMTTAPFSGLMTR